MVDNTGIIAFAFGSPAKIFSNEIIARIAAAEAKRLKGPIYTQRDIRIEFEDGIAVDYTYEESNKPPSTWFICNGAVEWAKQNNFNKLIIVAAKPHLWRCMRDIKKAVQSLGVEITVKACGEIHEYPYQDWFCRESVQLRTRSKIIWTAREWIIKLMPFSFYKMLSN